MYKIEFYETQNGESELWNFLENLRQKSTTNKDLRIQYKQMMFYIELLQNNGTRLGENITKHLDDGIWELNRETIEYFISLWKKILLCYFTILERNLRRHPAEKSKKQK